jgi:hypothetical protein
MNIPENKHLLTQKRRQILKVNFTERKMKLNIIFEDKPFFGKFFEMFKNFPIWKL